MELAYKTFASYDGTRIAYQTGGDGNTTIVLANGLGGDVGAWRPVIDRLGDDRRIVSWDYRGLFRSGPPVETHTLDPRSQARDLLAILEREGVGDFVLVGWSMGVQVSLEVVRAVAARVKGLVCVNGVAGKPFDTAFASRLSRHVLPMLVTMLRRNAPLASVLARRALAWPEHILRAMKRLGFVGRDIDAGLFADLASQYVTMDFDLYGATMEQLATHDAWDVLPSVRVPTAIVTGDRDRMTPLETARRMARAVGEGGARLVVLRGGTHYTPVEFPDEVAAEIRGVLERAEASPEVRR